MKKLLILAVLNIFIISGCSLFSGVRTNTRSGPAQHSVPMKIRNNEAAPKKRVLVLPFIDTKESRSPEVAKAARRSVVLEMARSGYFVVIQNSDFPKDLKVYLSNGQYNLPAISKIAKSLGIAAILEGKIIEVKARRLSDQVGVFRKVKAKVSSQVQIRVHASKNNKEILNTERSADIHAETTQVGQYEASDRFLEEDPKLVDSVIQKAFRGTVTSIYRSIDKIDWEGRIALVKADRIYLNAGRLSGLQIGDILKVMEQGEEIYDPETGVLIGRVPGRMKGTVEIVSYFGKDGAIGIVHSGSGFQENDQVEMY